MNALVIYYLNLVKAGDSSPEGEIDLLHNGEMERAQAWAEAILKSTNRRKGQ